MKSPRQLAKTILAILIVGQFLGAAESGTTLAADFNTPTNVNVLREFSNTGAQLVTVSSAVSGGAGFASFDANDGSGHGVAVVSFGAGSTTSQQFTLPGAQTVGSWQIQNGNASSFTATTLVLSGLVNGVWTQLDSFSPAVSAVITRTFAATSVSALKYVATGPNTQGGGTFFALNELEVFLAPGVSQSLSGSSSQPAFNLLRDTGRIVATHTSTNNTTLALVPPSNGSAATLIDGNYTGSAFLNASAGSGRAYVTYDFNQPYRMTVGSLGDYADQPINNWQVWTSNLPDPNEDLDSDWTLQYTQGATAVGSPGFAFLFSQPGDWEHLRFSWNVQNNAMLELEVYGFVPEPSTLMLLGSGGLLLWRRRVKK